MKINKNIYLTYLIFISLSKMDLAHKILLVTGSNKGIGYAILEGLLKEKSKLRMILTSRNENQGQTSLNKLISKYPDAKSQLYYHQLDISKKESREKLLKWIKEKFGKIDYLCNNAGVYTNPKKELIDINVFGTLNLTEELLKEDLINKNGKIISTGSDMGNSYSTVGKHANDYKNAKSYDDLINLTNKYLRNEISGSPYSVSKLTIHVYMKILGSRKDIVDKNISTYSMDPGWCRTDMGGSGAPYSVEHGAATNIYLLKLPDKIDPRYQGKHFRDSKVTDLF
jgi:NAD(P)-dependent dehydrogenase (short-subunit alcohol dehydrogenase family)